MGAASGVWLCLQPRGAGGCLFASLLNIQPKSVPRVLTNIFKSKLCNALGVLGEGMGLEVWRLCQASILPYKLILVSYKYPYLQSPSLEDPDIKASLLVPVPDSGDEGPHTSPKEVTGYGGAKEQVRKTTLNGEGGLAIPIWLPCG